MLTVDVTKLDRELREAKIPIYGVHSDGRVGFRSEATPEQRTAASEIVAAHNPAPTYAELRAKEYPRTDALVVALWERIVEGRTAASDSIQAKRAEIKAKYPKV